VEKRGQSNVEYKGSDIQRKTGEEISGYIGLYTIEKVMSTNAVKL